MTGLEIVSWLAAIVSAAGIGSALFRQGRIWAIVAGVFFLALNISVVVFIWKFNTALARPFCDSPFHEREVSALKMIAIPHYVILGLVAFAVLVFICRLVMRRDSDSGPGETKKVTVVEVRYIFTSG